MIELAKKGVPQELIVERSQPENYERWKKEKHDIIRKEAKLGLILNDIKEKENIQVTEDEIIEELKEQIKANPQLAKGDIMNMRLVFMYSFLISVFYYYNRMEIGNALLKERIYELLLSNAIFHYERRKL